MRRDPDLIRKIVHAVEDLPQGTQTEELKLEGYSREQVGYHSYLIVDSGLAVGTNASYVSDTTPIWHILNLTSEGHDFADASRNDTTWNKAKSLVLQQGGAFTLDILKDLLVKVIRSSTGLE